MAGNLAEVDPSRVIADRIDHDSRCFYQAVNSSRVVDRGFVVDSTKPDQAMGGPSFPPQFKGTKVLRFLKILRLVLRWDAFLRRMAPICRRLAKLTELVMLDRTVISVFWLAVAVGFYMPILAVFIKLFAGK